MADKFIKPHLSIEDLEQNPIIQFHRWFLDAQRANILEPNATVLSTITEDMFPTARTVLLKAYDEKGFVFFSSYNSNKAVHIDNNPKVSLLFVWLEMERQIKITGIAKKIGAAESFGYFMNRFNKIGSWIIEKNSLCSARSLLENKLGEMLADLKKRKIQFSKKWGGYRVAPISFEFWQGSDDKLYSRFLYKKRGGAWELSKIE